MTFLPPIIFLVFSILLASITAWLAYRARSSDKALLYSFGACALMLLLTPVIPFGVFLLSQSILTLFALMIAYMFAAKWRVVAVFGAAVAAVGLQGWIFSRAYWEYAHYLKEYPLASVSDRLAYEEARPSAQRPQATEPLSAAVEARLQIAERELRWSQRNFMLEMLHTRSAEQFVTANGFGAMRMIRFDPDAVALPEEEPLPPLPPPESYEPYERDRDGSMPLAMGESKTPNAAGPNDALIEEDSSRAIPQGELAARHVPVDIEGVAVRPASLENLRQLHHTGEQDFLHPDRFGWVKDRERVAGFEPHRFTKPPWSQTEFDGEREWRVTRLELVSILKHDPPRAYISEQLPRMDELADAPTRALNNFEMAALERLRSEEDVVVEHETYRIRMLGSLRASKNCTQCHFAERGELLGAFTYELERPRPPRERGEEPKRPQALWRQNSNAILAGR